MDRYLPGGGWPIGAIIEVFVERYGMGELTLLVPALIALTGGQSLSPETRAAKNPRRANTRSAEARIRSRLSPLLSLSFGAE